MNVVIRVDNSFDIGYERVSRMINFAKRLRDRGACVSFICKTLIGHNFKYVEDENFNCRKIGESANDEEEIVSWAKTRGADWVVIDNDIAAFYDYSKHNFKTLVIDDLCEVSDLTCDILINNNFYASEMDYSLKSDARKFLGPEYAMINDCYFSERHFYNPVSPPNILVYMGRDDLANCTYIIVKSILNFNFPIKANIVLGKSNKHKKKISEYIEKNSRIYHNIEILCEESHIFDIAKDCCVAIVSGSDNASFELCAMNVPMINIPSSNRDLWNAQVMQLEGIAINLGFASSINSEKMYNILDEMINDGFYDLHLMNKRSQNIMSCSMVSEIIDEMYERMRA